jgi:hypothetical protein
MTRTELRVQIFICAVFVAAQVNFRVSRSTLAATLDAPAANIASALRRCSAAICARDGREQR